MAKEKAEVVAGVPNESLVDAIRRVSRSLERLAKSGINRDGIIALVHDDTKVSKRTIDTVLDSLENLERSYCTKEGRC